MYNLLHTDDLTNEILEKIFISADAFQGGMQTKIKRHAWRLRVHPDYYRDKILATLFLEPSTRTRLSFETAMLRLGGQVISVSDGASCSVAKGESVYDTIKTVSEYANLIVVRSSEDFTNLDFVRCCPIINAGAGKFSHPTQAMLDAYTIWRSFGKLDNLKIGIIGDINNSRAINSFLGMLSKYPGNEFIRYDCVDRQSSETEILNALPSLDVLYLNRIQHERHTNPPDRIPFKLTDEHLKRLNLKAIVLNPGPRREELSSEFDSDPRILFFEQAKNGLYARMALLDYLLNPSAIGRYL